MEKPLNAAECTHLQKWWVALQLLYDDALQGLDEVFESIGVPYMPMKGSYLICAGIAHKISARHMADMDILVHPEDYQKTISLLSNHPHFEIRYPDPWFFEQAFFYIRGERKFNVELHCQLNRRERFRLPAQELFTRGYAQTKVRWLPSAEDSLVILICHTLVHIANGIKDCVNEEMEVLINQETFSWKVFLGIMESTGIMPFATALIKRCYFKKRSIENVTLKNYWWADLMLSLVPKRRRAGVYRVVYRAFAELFFVKDPLRLSCGWLFRKASLGNGSGCNC